MAAGAAEPLAAKPSDTEQPGNSDTAPLDGAVLLPQDPESAPRTPPPARTSSAGDDAVPSRRGTQHYRTQSGGFMRLTDNVLRTTTEAVQAVRLNMPDPIALLMPSSRRDGYRGGPSWWCATLSLTGGCVLGAAGFASSFGCWATDFERLCATSAAPLPDRLEEKLFDGRHLLDTFVLLNASVILLLSCGASLTDRLLRGRRRARILARVRRELDGVGTRTEVTARLMSMLSRSMRLVHDPSLRISISFDSLSYSLPYSGATVLTDACGEVLPGEFTAIMGPSGKPWLLFFRPNPNP
jgi:hypothetical protein